MKSLLVSLALCALATPAAAQHQPGPAEVVASLFGAMKRGDADAMAALMHDDVRLVSTDVRDGTPVVQSVPVDRWLESVRTSTRELDERIYDPVVHVDQGLAVVWARYALYVDGVHHHCGVDAFQLVLLPRGWRILDIADTRQTEGCPQA